MLYSDRHLSAIAKLNRSGDTPLFEITASGLNKASRNTDPEVDQTYTAPSFFLIFYGSAQIDWSRKKVTFNILDVDDKSQLSQEVSF